MAEVTGGLHNMRMSDDLLSDTVHGSMLSPGRKAPSHCAALDDTSLGCDHALGGSSHQLLPADDTPASDLAVVKEALVAAVTCITLTDTLPEQTIAKVRTRYSMQQLLMLQDKCTAKPDGIECLAIAQDVRTPLGTATPHKDAEAPMVTMIEGSKKQPACRNNKKRQQPNSPSQLSNKGNVGSPIVRTSLHKHLNKGAISTIAADCDSFCGDPETNLRIRTTGSSPATSVGLPGSATSVASTNSTAINFCGSNSSTPAAAAAGSFWAEEESVVLIRALVASLSDPDLGRVAQAAAHLAQMCATSTDDQNLVRQQQAVPILTKLLQSRDSEVQQHSAAALWSLSRGNAENQAVLVMSGALPRLVRLMASRSSAMQHVAASAVYELIRDQKRLQDPAADAGAIQMLAHVLKSGTLAGRRVAAETLEVIVTANTRNQAELLKAGALGLLIDLLRPDISESADDAFEAHNAAVSALLALMSSHRHHDAVVAAGARPLLQQILKGGQGVKAAKPTHIKVMAALQRLDHNTAAVSPCKQVANPLMKGNLLP